MDFLVFIILLLCVVDPLFEMLELPIIVLQELRKRLAWKLCAAKRCTYLLERLLVLF